MVLFTSFRARRTPNIYIGVPTDYIYPHYPSNQCSDITQSCVYELTLYILDYPSESCLTTNRSISHPQHKQSDLSGNNPAVSDASRLRFLRTGQLDHLVLIS